MRVAIIGGGPAGMTAAYQLSKSMGRKITHLDLYEKSKAVGGLSQSLDLWDQRVDLGPHRFFSHDRRINELWLEVVGEHYEIVNRQTRIYYRKRFFDYPVRAFNALRGLGPYEAFRCLMSYAGERLFPTRDTTTFEAWVTSRFGKRLYSIFFKTYTEKLWGIPTTELDSDFAAQRIKKLSLFEAIKNALFQGRSNKHATLVDQFAYPTRGTGFIYETMKNRVEEMGGRVHLNAGVEKVITSGNRARSVVLENGEAIEYDHIISSMPLSLLVESLPEVPVEILENNRRLSFRNTILVYLRVDHPELFSDQWLYIHDNSVQMGRVTNFRNWTASLHGDSHETILCLEYWCYFEDAIWKKNDKALVELAREEIQRTGLVKEGQVKEGKVVRLPRCYPVYFIGYREILQPIEHYLSNIRGLHVIGRYGAYKYNNQDHSILMGMRAAENILEGKGHDLWSINTDYEVYQESSVITRTGLVSTAQS